MQHMSMKNVMFHANDDEGHAVYWSDFSERFVLENKIRGRLSSFPFLCSALTEMHIITGHYYGEKYNPAEYVAQVPNMWTITENPYA